MSFGPVTFLFLIPALAAAVISLMPGSKLSAYVNAGASFLTFLAGLSLLWVESPAPGAYVLVDEFNTIFVVLITFVAFTTSVFSATYVEYELETGRVTPAFLKLYHALYQALTLCFVLALLSNNIGVMWVAIELATLTTVVMVGIYRTHAAIEAAWKYFILASVGIALALFGTILVYMAAEPVMGAGLNAMVWTDLVSHAASLEPAMLNLAFVFLLLGYGTKIGLFPLHAWLPDAHAEGPTPITAVLSGLLLNVALYALLRCKMLLAGNPEALAPGPLMIGMGLVSLLFGAFMLYRRRDIKRLFAYSSIEHMGLITFAFGLGGPIANFAGLLHMALHSLTKSGIFFAVGDISQVKGTQKIADMGGLTSTNPLIGWGLVIGVAAIAGLPPLGIFTSEFLIVSATLAKQPLLALPLVLGLLIAIGALFLQLNRIAFGEPKGPNHKVKCSYVPMILHLGLVLIAGVYLPASLVAWLQAVAKLLG
jgi:hydrogenase-4 component F